jgi:hypothetical protein
MLVRSRSLAMPLVQHRVKRLLLASVRQNRLIQPARRGSSLKWTASWDVRRIDIGCLRNASESRFIEVFIEWLQRCVARFLLHKGRVAAHTKPGFDTGAHKPRPDSFPDDSCRHTGLPVVRSRHRSKKR